MEHNKQVKLIIAFVVLFVALLLATMIVVSIPAAQVLTKMEDTSKSDLTIKITGHQWKWSYEYIDTDIKFDSSLRREGGQASSVEGKEAIYRGQCAELCGKGHAYMPIVVKVVSGAEFDAWVSANGNYDALVASSQVSEKPVDLGQLTLSNNVSNSFN